MQSQGRSLLWRGAGYTRHLLLSSALTGSLALAPLAVQAQDYETWVLDREVLNAAANYTGVLTAAHAHVRKYITWQWETSLSVEEQQQRTAEILAQIAAGAQVDPDLVSGLERRVVSGYDIRFRYCDGKLLSYFADNNFKHGLRPQQIIDAPVLRAERAGSRFTGEPLGRVKNGEGGLMLHLSDSRSPRSGRSAAIPACLATTDTGGALAEGTVAYMSAAPQKFGVARVRKVREVQTLICQAPQVGAGIRQQRFQSTDYNAQNDPLYNTQSDVPYDAENEDLKYPYYDTVDPEGDGHWNTPSSQCRTPATIPIHQIRDCPDGDTGSATYEVFLTETYGEFPSIVWVPSNEAGQLTGDVTGQLVPHLSHCGDDTPDSLRLEPDISYRTETRAGICPAPHTRGSLSEAREVEIRRWRFADNAQVQGLLGLDDVVIEIEGDWATSDDRCYRTVDETTPETKALACAAGYSGTTTYRRAVTVRGTDWHDPKWSDLLTTTQTEWVATNSTSCTLKPRGGGGDERGGQESVDVDGDGQGDYRSSYDAEQAGKGRGRPVDGGCGSCNGTRPGPTGGKGGNGRGGGNGGGGGGCFLTTAIVERRGEADDGPTLTTLRGFRDSYMAHLPEGPALVLEYYEVAPRIVAAIPASDPAWDWIGGQIDHAVAQIKAGDQPDAFATYKAMVQRLKADWLTQGAGAASQPDITDREETIQ